MVTITKTVNVAVPVSRRVAQEIFDISWRTCLTNCAGDVLTINQGADSSSNNDGVDMCNLLKTSAKNAFPEPLPSISCFRVSLVSLPWRRVLSKHAPQGNHQMH
jgi:hypothetical protein